jgi:hypothetical protein
MCLDFAKRMTSGVVRAVRRTDWLWRWTGGAGAANRDQPRVSQPRLTDALFPPGAPVCLLSFVYWVCVVGTPDVVAAPLKLSSTLSVSEHYDSNIYLSQTDAVGDLTTIVSPRVELTVDDASIHGALRYQASAEWYRTRSTENRLSHQAEAEASLKALQRLIRGLDLQVSGSYSRAGQLPGTSLGDTPPQSGGTILLSRMETTQGRGGLMAAYGWTRRLESRLGYDYTATTYDSTDAHNSVTHDARLGFRYRLSPSTTITLNPGWREIRIDPAAGDPAAAADTTATTRLSAGAEYSIGPTWTAGGKIGATIVEDDQTRLVMDFDLQRRWKQGRVGFTGGQDVGTGGGVTDTVSLVQRLGVDASQTLSAKMQVSLRLDYSRNVSLPADPLIRSIRIQTYRAGAGATYRILGWLDGSADYSFFVQDSVGIAVDGKRHVVMFALTARAPGWRLFD